MASGNNIRVEVVVSGKAVTVTINSHEKVEALIREALKEANQPHGDDLSAWQLRTAEGHIFADHSQRITDAGIVDGVKLFLNKDAGGGGQAWR